MAYEMGGRYLTLKSSGDMSSAQYHLVTASTTNSADGCIIGPSSAGGKVIGVWQDNSSAATHGKVQFDGISKVQLSTGTAAVSVGSWLTGSTAGGLGRAMVSTSTDARHHLIGQALAAAAAGSSGVIPVLLMPTAKTDATA